MKQLPRQAIIDDDNGTQNFFIVLSLQELAYAQTWQLIGPPGGRVSAIAINPQNPALVYTGTRDGALFRSNDHGISTENINHDAIIGNVSHIAIDPQNPNILYTSVYRSADGGNAWNKMDGGGAQYAINPLDPRTLFVTRYLNEIWVTRYESENPA